MIQLTRRYRFPAAHVLRHPRLSEEENVRTYGKCAHPHGHGHDYGVEVTVGGTVDRETGAIVPIETLDALVEERVLARFSHRLLNEVEPFGERVPTAENIAETIHRELDAGLAGLGGARLVRVRLIETRRNQFEYGEPG